MKKYLGITLMGAITILASANSSQADDRFDEPGGRDYWTVDVKSIDKDNDNLPTFRFKKKYYGTSDEAIRKGASYVGKCGKINNQPVKVISCWANRNWIDRAGNYYFQPKCVFKYGC